MFTKEEVSSAMSQTASGKRRRCLWSSHVTTVSSGRYTGVSGSPSSAARVAALRWLFLLRLHKHTQKNPVRRSKQQTEHMKSIRRRLTSFLPNGGFFHRVSRAARPCWVQVYAESRLTCRKRETHQLNADAQIENDLWSWRLVAAEFCWNYKW